MACGRRMKMGFGSRFRRLKDWVMGFTTPHVEPEIESLKNNIQAKDEIISELKKKLVVQEHDGIEDGLENKNLIRTSRIGASQFDLLRILGIGGFGTVYLAQKKGGTDDGQLYAMKVLKKTLVIQQDAVKGTMAQRQVL
jgi:serine/threonine protein kinase